MSAHPIKNGTWLKSHVAIQEDGPRGPLSAPEGQIGCIKDREDRTVDGAEETVYHVRFYPTGIMAYFTSQEIDRDVELLNRKSRDIPTNPQISTVETLVAIFEDGDVSEVFRDVRLTSDQAVTLAISLPGREDGVSPLSLLTNNLEQDPDGPLLDHEILDEIAAKVGYVDRFVHRPALAPAPTL